MSRYLALSDRASGPQSTGVRDVTHLIWPESAFPFFLTARPMHSTRSRLCCRKDRADHRGGARTGNGANTAVTRAYNSIYVIDHDGSILSVYDKVHLVPFGEYLPLQGFARAARLDGLTKVRGGFIPGDRRRVLSVPRGPSFLPLICYEVIFPGEAVPAASAPAGCSISPMTAVRRKRRALSALPAGALARHRRGLPLVRAANTGISAVVDPLGRIVASLPLGTEEC